jgi:hypothetical protein
VQMAPKVGKGFGRVRDCQLHIAILILRIGHSEVISFTEEEVLSAETPRTETGKASNTGQAHYTYLSYYEELESRTVTVTWISSSSFMSKCSVLLKICCRFSSLFNDVV